MMLQAKAQEDKKRTTKGQGLVDGVAACQAGRRTRIGQQVDKKRTTKRQQADTGLPAAKLGTRGEQEDKPASFASQSSGRKKLPYFQGSPP